MRKLYSIVLTACAMLFSMGMSAETVNNADALQKAINDGETSIVLGTGFTVTTPIKVFADPTKEITIDLAGNTLESSSGKILWIFKGTIKIIDSNETETSGILYNGTNDDNVVIQVEGQGDPTQGNWSNLTIEEGVKVKAEHGNAIVIDGTIDAEQYTYMEESVLTGETMTTCLYNANTTVVLNYDVARTNYLAGAGYTKSGSNYNIAKSDNGGNYTITGYSNKFPMYQKFTGSTTLYKKDGESYTKDGLTWYKKYTGTQFALAYGANVTIKGHVEGYKYGVKINGLVRKATGYSENYLPCVHVTSTGEVKAQANLNKAVAMYSAGYGKFIIEGHVHAATGVYVKSGKVELKDYAVVESDFGGDYVSVVGQSSGVSAGGSAITIESNSSYSGSQDVTISGDVTVKGTSGYAIEEKITTALESKVSSVTITGGNIEAGDKGTIVMDNRTVDNIVVVGGNIADNVQIFDGHDYTPATVDQLFPNDGEVYISTTVKNEEGKDVIVVTKLDGTTVNNSADNSVVATPAGEGVIWDNTTTTEETIQTSREFSYIQISEDYAQKLNIGDADHEVVVKVGRIVLGTKAQIVVSAGSTLIITGDQGIYSPTTSNLVLETSESNPSQFIFSPIVTSNRHPNATVSLIANSRTSATDPTHDYTYQRFGVPTHGAIKNMTAKKDGADVQVFVQKYENNGWLSLGYLNVAGQSLRKDKMNDPFGYYIMQCNTPEVGTVVSFEGELVGNDNTNLTTGQNTNGWSTFTNSYSANLDMSAMLTMFNGLGDETNVGIYFQKPIVGTDNQFLWDILNEATKLFFSADKFNLKPMQSFLIKDPNAQVDQNNSSLSLNYKTMVYDPAMAAAEAPAPRRAMSNLTMASVKVMNNGDAVYMIQGDEFSSEMEKGYDSEKYMSGNANIYVMSDKKYVTCATDNLENTYLGFSCAEAGNYTISFEHIAGEGLALVDMVANKVINMTEGATYEFYAQESNDYRFKVVGRNNVATDVETVENAVKAAGVYTLTGMYLGNMSVWNTLPAGVYVVDGEKRVK